MEYEIYHDESKEAGYWHGMFFVPKITRSKLLKQLAEARQISNYYSPVSLKNLSSKGKMFKCMQLWSQIGSASLRQYYNNENIPIIFPIGPKVENNRYLGMEYGVKVLNEEDIIKSKLIIFRERDDHKLMDSKWLPDYGSKVETTARMGLKGGLHFFDGLMIVDTIHFDGYKHYGRRINKARLIDRLKGLKENISVEKVKISDESSDHTRNDRQTYENCQLLQLTDVLVGGFRIVLEFGPYNSVQKEAVFPLFNLLTKWRAGKKRMLRSRWHKGFCISQCYLENERWHFERIKRDTLQLKLQI